MYTCIFSLLPQISILIFFYEIDRESVFEEKGHEAFNFNATHLVLWRRALPRSTYTTFVFLILNMICFFIFGTF